MALNRTFLARQGFARKSIPQQNAAIYDAVNRRTERIVGTLGGVTPGVLVAAGDYAALDVMSDSASAGNYWVFPNCAKEDGGTGKIRKLIATTSVEGMTAKLRLWLLHTAPTTTAVNDNVAFSLTVADRDKVVGYIDLAASVDMGTVSYSQNVAMELDFECASDNSDLYGILVVVDAFTGEASGETVTLQLSVEQF